MINDHMVAGFLVGSVRLKRLGYCGALPCILPECVVAGLTRLDLTLRDSVTDVSYCPSTGFSRGTASPGASLGTLMRHQVASGWLQVGGRIDTVGSNLV